MQRLFQILLKYRAFIIFVLLEFLSGWLIIQNNQYQSAAFFNSSNALAGNIINATNYLSEYLSLRKVNQELSQENAILRNQLLRNPSVTTGSTSIDSTLSTEFEYIPAKVINNSTRRFKNYLTLNKGSNDGVEPGMGVIGIHGIVGVVKSSSNHFATIISLLHGNMLVSSKIESSNTLCTTKWDGVNPLRANLLYVPRHIELNIGDTVSTSGYNAIFPEKILIGTISQVKLPEDATFYDIRISLSTEFHGLSYVYVLQNNLKAEKISLEVNSITE
ncbi:MAG: rod shape-determining protein MreC [Bacteroidetes bacterium]|nr:rod shape-determining protein MreC [Bacteroidota bacterium]